MADTISAQDGTTSTPLWRLADLGIMLRCSDMPLAVGMIAILVVLILPLPPLLLEVRSPSRSRFPLFIPCAKRACWLS
jgi:hypothetical protein